MDVRNDLRTSKRVPIGNKVQVKIKGRMASYALAINISAGGLLLSAAPALPVGTPCELAIPLSIRAEGKSLLTEGTVIRNDDMGTAIQFTNELEESVYKKFVTKENAFANNSVLNSYINYFKVSQSHDPADCEKLIGISRKIFNNVFLTTFCTCIPLAILPVLIFQSSIPIIPIWAKLTYSFGYGLIWIGIIQPSIDLIVFKVIKNRAVV